MEFDGPIPGENYTSDTKNYPWHRPPENTDLDQAIETSFKKLTEDDNIFGLLTMLENGVTVSQVTSMFVISGIGAGKWTPDFALLLAGPVAHIIYLLAKGYGVDCELGIDNKTPYLTSTFFKEVRDIDKNKAKRIAKEIDLNSVKEQASGGFMNMKSEGEAPQGMQEAMLGYDEDEVEEDE